MRKALKGNLQAVLEDLFVATSVSVVVEFGRATLVAAMLENCSVLLLCVIDAVLTSCVVNVVDCIALVSLALDDDDDIALLVSPAVDVGVGNT